ncbi:hypothetical protein, partial [Candidatus Binatus sp.]|uniref:hypothetical protein n=1 Tax=Candidatus Binatus sp. TaxID=2811406 RepID=UPI003BAEF38D
RNPDGDYDRDAPSAGDIHSDPDHRRPAIWHTDAGTLRRLQRLFWLVCWNRNGMLSKWDRWYGLLRQSRQRDGDDTVFVLNSI